MTRPRLLDLFCGAGGASHGYYLAGYDVVGVDHLPQPHYPYEFHQHDALDYPLHGFDAVHASPPCQAFTAYQRRHNHVTPRPNLIPAVREKLQASGLPYIIENVNGAPLHDPIMLCGSSFGLDIRRHRLFESNRPLIPPPCDHKWQKPRFPPAANRINLRSTVEIGVWRIPMDVQNKAMGIDWMPLKSLSQAIPPAYTKYLGEQLLPCPPR